MMTGPEHDTVEFDVEDVPAEPSSGPGWEVVCPDGLVRHYPFNNHGNAEETARSAKEKQCRLWSEPSPLETSQPPCPEGEHVVRSLGKTLRLSYTIADHATDVEELRAFLPHHGMMRPILKVIGTRSGVFMIGVTREVIMIEKGWMRGACISKVAAVVMVRTDFSFRADCPCGRECCSNSRTMYDVMAFVREDLRRRKIGSMLVGRVLRHVAAVTKPRDPQTKIKLPERRVWGGTDTAACFWKYMGLGLKAGGSW